MSPACLQALLDGRRDETAAAGGFTLQAGWPDDHDGRFLRLRLQQMRQRPEDEPWLVRAMVFCSPDRPMIGHIGFHGPPRHGAAEMGYTVFQEYRRRGYALEAARGMMDWARTEHGVRRFIVSISPSNTASLALAEKLGFRHIGEQVDEEDGLELVFGLVRE